MDFSKCVACRQLFKKCSKVLQQRYCSSRKCQLERRRLSQKNKRNNDPDYKDNQSRAQQEWLKRNPNYWKEYRQNHPKYRDQNRKKQHQRNKIRKTELIAKMGVNTPNVPLISGIYHLVPVTTKIAKMDSFIVEITLISSI